MLLFIEISIVGRSMSHDIIPPAKSESTPFTRLRSTQEEYQVEKSMRLTCHPNPPRD